MLYINVGSGWKQKNVSESQLYELIDSPEEDDIACIQASTTDTKDIAIWECIILAVAFTCQSAYVYNGEAIFPQAIEIVDFGYYDESKSIYEQLSLDSGNAMDSIENDFLNQEKEFEKAFKKSMFDKYFLNSIV